MSKIEKVWNTAKDIALFGFMAALAGLFCIAIYASVHGIGSGPITVTVGDGRYSTRYNTHKVLPAGPGCIKFKADGDTITACGNYKVRQ